MFKDLFKPVDMTQGDSVQNLIRFAIPMLIGNIAQQLYNTVDSIIVGRYVGDNALAAVGSAGPVLNLMLVLFMGIATGASIMVSQFFGARRREDLSRAICTCMILTAVASGIIMLVGPMISKPMLRLLNTPESIIGWCRTYLNIIFLGVAGGGYYNIMSGILRGLGDSVSALKYLLIATFTNIILDWTFVAKFGMGVAGVAWATIAAQILSAVFCVRKILRMKDIFEVKAEYFKNCGVYAKNLIRLGVPAGLTQMVFSAASIIVQSLTNSFGEMFIAANVIVMRIDGFVMMPAFSFGSAMTTFTGQNIGAGRMDRVDEGTKRGTLTAMAVSAVLTGLILLFGKHLMAIFTSTDELITMANNMMRILAVGYIAVEVTQCLSGVMRGAGDTMTPMWISMISTVRIRVPLAYILVRLTKSARLPKGNCYMMPTSMLITWLIGAVITFVLFRRGSWRRKALDRMN